MLLFVVMLMTLPIFASSSETVEIPSDRAASVELSPMSGDMMNIIITLICISGTAVIILVLISLSSKK